MRLVPTIRFLREMPAGQRMALWLTGFALALAAMQAALGVERAWPFTTDDAYITLRYSKLLVSGDGLRFNRGEPPTEGYSNFLSVLLGAASMKIGWDPVLVLKILGVGGFVGAAGLSFFLARRWLPPLPSALPVAWSTAHFGGSWWAVSGLETGMYQVVVVSCVLLTLSSLGYGPVGSRTSESPRGMAGAALLAALASVIRPEGPLLALVALGTTLIHFGTTLTRRAAPGHVAARRAVLWFVAAFAVPYAAYFAFRASHFERWLPNPVYCKGAYGGDPWVLLRDALHDFWPLLLLSMFAWLQAPRRALVPLFALPLAYALTLHGVDPEVGYHSRHFLAAGQLVLVSAAVGAWNLTLFLGRERELRRSIAATCFGAVIGPRFEPDALREEASSYARRMRVRQELADFVNAGVSGDDWIMLGDAGLVPYRSKAKIIDAYCLNTREMTEPPISFSAERFVVWALNRRPKFIIVSSWDDQRLKLQTYFGVWPALLKLPEFQANYHLVATRPTEDFVTYSVFERGQR